MSSIKQHYLIPCMLFCEKEEYAVTTVLGSCVSVCLYDRFLHLGGINHYMLPLWNGNGLETPKYGNIAISRLVEMMLEIGCEKKNLVAKIFGGARVLGSDHSPSAISIGDRNVEIAEDMLKNFKIPLVASSTGDLYGRKIMFNTKTGDILLKRVKRISDGE